MRCATDTAAKAGAARQCAFRAGSALAKEKEKEYQGQDQQEVEE
jgi:hypothetical protein